MNRELNIVRGCFSRAVEWGLIESSPASGVRPYRVENTRVRVLSPDEIGSLLSGLSGDFRLMARATLEGLFRLSEVLNLRVEDVGKDYVTLVHTKNGRVRKVPITAALRTDLLARAHSGGFVFGREPEGQPPRVETASVQFRRLVKKLGLQGVSHHTLRHTAASMMLERGASVRAVQELGGWTSLRMLERYAHPTDAEKRKAIEGMAALTAGTKTGTAARIEDARQRSTDGKPLIKNQLKGRPQGETTICTSVR